VHTYPSKPERWYLPIIKSDMKSDNPLMVDAHNSGQ
jgi:hypothetical protein